MSCYLTAILCVCARVYVRVRVCVTLHIEGYIAI